MGKAEDSRDGTREQDGIFPVFRKLIGARHFYRIDAPDRFSEVLFIGGKPVFHEVDARAYPEQVRVAEMIHGDNGRYEPIDAAVWEGLFRPK